MFRKFSLAGKTALVVPAALALSVSAAFAGNVDVGVSINIGNPPPPRVEPPPRVIVEPPPRVIVEPAPAPVIIEEDVYFVYPERLGFYVAVGVPYDLFYVQNTYYLCRDGRWYRAARSQGPWVTVERRELPRGIRKNDLKRIRYYRDAEHNVYRRDRDHYRGRYFMTAKDQWKAQARAEKEYRKEERREEKEYWKERKREEKEDRRGEREHGRRHNHDD